MGAALGAAGDLGIKDEFKQLWWLRGPRGLRGVPGASHRLGASAAVPDPRSRRVLWLVPDAPRSGARTCSELHASRRSG